MPVLLTVNGVPPQKIGFLTSEQQHSIAAYASTDMSEKYDCRKSNWPKPLEPFAAAVREVADCFVNWGAAIDTEGYCFVHIKSDDLKKGATTFQPDANLHADSAAYPQSANRLSLRFLCVSSMPAAFLDLTKHTDMVATLDPYRRQPGGRVFRPSLLRQAEQNGDARHFSPWETVLFDSATPHLPQIAGQPHRRILLSGWIDTTLPQDWRARVASGDGPCLIPARTADLRAEVRRPGSPSSFHPEQL